MKVALTAPSLRKWPVIGLLSLAIITATSGSSTAYASTVNDGASSHTASSAVVSTRKFTPQNEVQAGYRGHDTAASRSATRESISTTVESNVDWGGLGSMNIDYQQSPAQSKSADNLRNQINGANQTYSSSNGKMESNDNHLRDDLKAAIDKGNGLLGNMQSSVADMDGQAGVVASGAKAVNDAVARKQADDVASAAVSRSASRSSITPSMNQGQINDSFNSWKSSHGDASMGQQVLQYAMQYNGYPYVWGATGPSSFDCSGLVMYAYGHFGINLPHFSGSQAQQGVEVPASQMQPGDVIANSEHAALYYGKINGVDYVFNALNPSAGVTFTPLAWAFSSSYHIRRVY